MKINQRPGKMIFYYRDSCPRCKTGAVKVVWGESATCMACGWDYVSRIMFAFDHQPVYTNRGKSTYSSGVADPHDPSWDNVVAAYEGD